MKYIILAGLSFIMMGCATTQYKLDNNLIKNTHTQVIVNDFINYLRMMNKKGTWIKIDEDMENVYLKKLKATAIRRGFKVCTKKCPKRAILFSTDIERIDEDMIVATLRLPKSMFNRIYKIDKNGNIKRFGNKTVYKKSL